MHSTLSRGNGSAYPRISRSGQRSHRMVSDSGVGPDQKVRQVGSIITTSARAISVGDTARDIVVMAGSCHNDAQHLSASIEGET